MRRITLFCIATILVLGGLSLYSASGTPSNLVVRTDANNYLLITSVTQTNPVTQGVFASRTLRTDANGSLQVILTGTVTPTYPQAIPASTCAAPSLGMSGGATTGIAFTATPSILNCISGTARTTLTASSFTSTVIGLWPDGTISAPSNSFSTDSDTGTSRVAANRFGIIAGGAWRAVIDGAGIINASDQYFGWSGSAGDASTAPDTFIFRAAAGVISMTRTALGTTSSTGLQLVNSTAATGGTTVQISPRLLWRGTAWDTAASQTVDFFAEVLPATAATPTGTWKLGYSLNGAAATYPLTVTNTGSLNVLSSLGGAGTGTSVANVGANSCGTTAATIAGNQVSGVITVGTVAGTQCRVTFTTAAPVARECTVTDSTTTIATRSTYIDTTNTDFLGAFVAGDLITFNCMVR